MFIWNLLGQLAEEFQWAFRLILEIYLFALAALFSLCLSRRALLYWTLSKHLRQKRRGHESF